MGGEVGIAVPEGATPAPDRQVPFKATRLSTFESDPDPDDPCLLSLTAYMYKMDRRVPVHLFRTRDPGGAGGAGAPRPNGRPLYGRETLPGVAAFLSGTGRKRRDSGYGTGTPGEGRWVRGGRH